MYIILTDIGAKTGKNLSEVNKRMNAAFEENEFKQLGPDRIMQLTRQDLEFVQDKRRMSRIPIEKLFKKNSTTTLIMAIILLMEFILLVRG